MNGKQAKQLRKLQNESVTEIKKTVTSKIAEDSKGYWNHIAGDTFVNRVKMAFDMIIGRKR